VAFLTYVITSHNVMVYTVINVVSVYDPDTLHNRMSSAAVLISGHGEQGYTISILVHNNHRILNQHEM